MVDLHRSYNVLHQCHFFEMMYMVRVNCVVNVYKVERYSKQIWQQWQNLVLRY